MSYDFYKFPLLLYKEHEQIDVCSGDRGVFFLSQELDLKILLDLYAGAKVLALSGRISLLVECVWENLCLFCHRCSLQKVVHI